MGIWARVIGGGDGEGGGERPSALGSGVSRWRGGQMRRSGFPAVGWVWEDQGGAGAARGVSGMGSLWSGIGGAGVGVELGLTDTQ